MSTTRAATEQSVKMSRMKSGSIGLCSGLSVEEDTEVEEDKRAVLCLHIRSLVSDRLNCRPGGRSWLVAADTAMREEVEGVIHECM